MRRLSADMPQAGIVVRDIQAAMPLGVCGVGPPFYNDRQPVTAFTYAGRRRDDQHISIAPANLGAVAGGDAARCRRRDAAAGNLPGSRTETAAQPLSLGRRAPPHTVTDGSVARRGEGVQFRKRPPRNPNPLAPVRPSAP